MADQTFSFAVTTQPGVSQANPQITSLAMPPRTVTAIEVIVPPGPNGQLAFAIGMDGNQVIPAVRNTWLIVSDYQQVYDTSTTLNSGAWQCLSYNTGLYPHTVQIIFHVNLLSDPLALVVPTAIDATVIMAAGTST